MSRTNQGGITKMPVLACEAKGENKVTRTRLIRTVLIINIDRRQ